MELNNYWAAKYGRPDRIRRRFSGSGTGTDSEKPGKPHRPDTSRSSYPDNRVPFESGAGQVMSSASNRQKENVLT